eukprot:GHVL01021513.1.p1 GENE.GHVL01021513.1~~GHVL01021513.1.p1  ORF type:complete len:465 (+),score=81.49 GHVL01021513.1:1372-2766(+)
MIITDDEYSCRIVTAILGDDSGGRILLNNCFKKYLYNYRERVKRTSGRGLLTIEARLLSLELEKLRQGCDDYLFNSISDVEEEIRAFHDLDIKPTINVTVAGNQLTIALEDFRPNIIILYESKLDYIRQIESYASLLSLPSSSIATDDVIDLSEDEIPPINVYLIKHGDSVEDDIFRESVNLEKDAFDQLIKQKKQLVVLPPTDPPLVQPTITSSRKGGGRGKVDKEIVNFILVDQRELRSPQLPFRLYQRGIKMISLTLLIGDYILSRDIAVERKSISDLFQSFDSGRLFNQCESMARVYTQPSLLVEFDRTNHGFSLQPKGVICPNDINQHNIISKICILVLHFPSLRFIWSPTTVFTADLFCDLKAGREQPNQTRAMSKNDDKNSETSSDKNEDSKIITNHSAMEMLRRMPGVTQKFLHILMQKGKNLSNIARMSKEELINIIGKSNGNTLYSFLNNCADV